MDKTPEEDKQPVTASHSITKENTVTHSRTRLTQKQFFWGNIVYIVVIFSTITGIVIYAASK